MLAVLLGAALVGYGARFALRLALEKYEARLTDRIRSDVESKMLSPPERPPRACEPLENGRFRPVALGRKRHRATYTFDESVRW